MTFSSNNDAAIPIEDAKSVSESVNNSTLRIKSEDLLQQKREIEIDHGGRIYRLRLTQLNKLILTA